VSRLREIPHVKIIRIGTKMPAFNPQRIIDDPALLEMLSRYSSSDGRIYIMTHFNVAEELSEKAKTALDLLMRSGVVLANQSPVLRGINHRPAVLAKLMRALTAAGVPPYYFFQCRPTEGNLPFEIPLVEAYRAVEQAMTMVCGLAKRARLVMSHTSGKIEMVGLNRRYIYLRYHRARDPQDEGRFMICHRDDSAYWFDDLHQVQHLPRHDDAYGTGDHLTFGLD
jgi:L-lysine 2,3-aminomutase